MTDKRDGHDVTRIEPNEFQELTAQVRKDQETLIQARGAVCSGIQKLEKMIEAVIVQPLKREFLNLRVLNSQQGGCMTDQWQPEVLVTTVTDEGRAQIARREDTILGWYVGRKKVDPGIDPQALIDECATLTRRYGVKVEPHYWSDWRLGPGPADPTTAPPAGVGDLLDMYGNKAVLEHGQVATKGWDIIDHWAIALVNGRTKLYFWGTGANGRTNNVDTFLQLVEEDNGNDWVRDKWRDRIVAEWGGVECPA